MIAESAAGAGATGTPEANGAAAAQINHSPIDQAASEARLQAILGEEGGGGGAQTEENTNGNEQATEGAPAAAGAGGSAEEGGHPTDGDGNAAEQSAESGGQGDGASRGGEEDDEPPALTDEEKRALPDWVMPRIARLTAKKNEAKQWKEANEPKLQTLETEVAQLREQVKSVQPLYVQPSRRDPLADVESPEQLQAAIAELEEGVEWAELNADGATDVDIVATSREARSARQRTLWP